MKKWSYKRVSFLLSQTDPPPPPPQPTSLVCVVTIDMWLIIFTIRNRYLQFTLCYAGSVITDLQSVIPQSVSVIKVCKSVIRDCEYVFNYS